MKQWQSPNPNPTWLLSIYDASAVILGLLITRWGIIIICFLNINLNKLLPISVSVLVEWSFTNHWQKQQNLVQWCDFLWLCTSSLYCHLLLFITPLLDIHVEVSSYDITDCRQYWYQIMKVWNTELTINGFLRRSPIQTLTAPDIA